MWAVFGFSFLKRPYRSFPVLSSPRVSSIYIFLAVTKMSIFSEQFIMNKFCPLIHIDKIYFFISYLDGPGWTMKYAISTFL